MAEIGSIVLHIDRTESTNDTGRQMASAGAVEGTCIVASRQTAGRGRQGRSWVSPPGEGLYLSVILRPGLSPDAASLITLAAAVAVAETLRDFNVPADIKWPNDVLAGTRKISGILAESAVEAGRVQYVVLGVGINVGQSGFPEEIRDVATSILIETGCLLSPDDLLPGLLSRLEFWYRELLSGPERVLSRWEQLSTSARGMAVRISSPEEILEGTTRGITPAGSLLVETRDGALREVYSGEVSLRPL